jgi:hypothetical protein
MHRRPSKADAWAPSVLGMSKRDLLKEVLTVFGELVSALYS